MSGMTKAAHDSEALKITGVMPGDGDYDLTLRWEGGSVSRADLTEPIFRSKHLRALRNKKRFREAKVADRGRAISWGDNLDFSAERLWQMTKAQASTAMVPSDFRAWLKYNGLTQKAAARRLGISKRSVAYYSTGAQPITRTVVLALRAAGRGQPHKGYQRLDLDVADWPHVERFIRGPLENLYFRDIHDMLRLPIKEAGIGTGCNFAVAHVLLAAVGGISTTLSSPGARSRYQRAFCNLLVRSYPWETEPKGPRTETEKQEIGETLWKEFHGPLTHHLGFWMQAPRGRALRNRDRGYAVKFKRMTVEDGNGLPDVAIAQLERSETWPFPEFQQTLQVRIDAKVLKLERFYWGIRRMVVRLSEQREVMKQAEAFLSKVESEANAGKTGAQ